MNTRFVKTFWSFHVTFACALLRLNEFQKITEFSQNSDSLFFVPSWRLTLFGRQNSKKKVKTKEPLKFLPVVYESYRLRLRMWKHLLNGFLIFHYFFVFTRTRVCVKLFFLFYISHLKLFSRIEFSIFHLDFNESTWFHANTFQAFVVLSTRQHIVLNRI